MQSNKRIGKHLIRSLTMQNGDKPVKRKSVWWHHSWENTYTLQYACMLTELQCSNGDILHHNGACTDKDIAAFSFRLYKSVNRDNCCLPAAGRLIS